MPTLLNISQATLAIGKLDVKKGPLQRNHIILSCNVRTHNDYQRVSRRAKCMEGDWRTTPCRPTTPQPDQAGDVIEFFAADLFKPFALATIFPFILTTFRLGETLKG
jgi:hypothetical protein